jgi:DNA-directed RNA polymerase subunit omega
MVENRFALVLLATKRTRQLMAGARPLLQATKNKPTVQSLREIATGKVRFDRSVRDALAGKFDREKVAVGAGQTRTLK